MYGKENHTEAAGCSIVFDASFLNETEGPTESGESKASIRSSSDSPVLYRVAYLDEDGNVFIGEKKNKKLTDLLKKLKTHLKTTSREQLRKKNALNEIRYLFKHTYYRHENECRIVIPALEDNPRIKICNERTPPRVYIEIGTDNMPVFVKSVTVGPKAERAEEWAAAFKVRLSRSNPDKDIPVSISTLPFK